MKLKLYILLVVTWAAQLVASAQEIAIGQWRMHLAYKEGLSVTRGNGKIYCAAKGGLFAYKTSDNSFEILSKLSGLSDESVNTINFDASTNTLVIAYKNANIDIIQNGTITNLPDIKLKSIQGNKTINSIFFRNQLAYLSCGFGIVVLDLNKRETKETYFIGPNGSTINIRDVNCDGTSLFACTDNGIYSAPLNSANLSDFNSWSKQSGLPGGIYNTMAYFNGKIYANQAMALAGKWYKDIVFRYDGTKWDTASFTQLNSSNTSTNNFKHLLAENGLLTVVGEYEVRQLDASETQIGIKYNAYGFDNAWPAEATIDNSGTAWIADRKYGLTKITSGGSAEVLIPNGPKSTSVFALGYGNGKVWSVPGGVTDNWGANLFNTEGVSIFSDNNWSTIYGAQPAANMDSLHDVISIAVDPDNSSHAFAGSYLHGLLEFNAGKLVDLYTPKNSTLQSQQAILSYYKVEAGGVSYDEDGNLWVANSETNRVLSVRKKNGSWQGIDFSNFVKNDRTSLVVAAKVSGQKWVVLPGNSILVYKNDGGTPSSNNSNTKRISNVDLTINGNKIAALPQSNLIPGTLLKCVAEDQDGAMWMGTDAGVAVIYSPENIFGGGGWEPQQIYVQQDGHTQLLLATEEVMMIAVDGANRKWIGTYKSGVFLMSPDGTKEIYHFTTANSPLLSNTVNAITINNETGEVFFGTTAGIISYKGTATEGGEDFKDVYAYPNPVRPDYTGPIAIKGLVKNTDVKITDIAGTLIFHTKSLGGQAIWDGKNFSGERAQTGVYLVFCANDDGSKTTVTKILFIN